MIHKIPPSVDFNKWLKRLDIQLDKPTNQISLKDSKVVSYRIRRRYYNTLGTSVKKIVSFLPEQTAIFEQLKSASRLQIPV